MKIQKNYAIKWIFFVHFSPKKGNSIMEGYERAFANLLVYSVKIEDAIKIVRRCLNEIDFKIEKILCLEYFPERLENYKVSKEVRKAADFVSEKNVFAIGGPFSAYPFEKNEKN